jgi:hypothetical protein
VFKAEGSKESKKVESVEEEPSDLPFWSHKGLQQLITEFDLIMPLNGGFKTKIMTNKEK